MQEESNTAFSLQSQVYLVVGGVVLLTTLLGAFASRWWLVVPAALSLGLLNAARTGICPLMKMLSKLPFNQPSSGKLS
jgi:hypothetical protein